MCMWRVFAPICCLGLHGHTRPMVVSSPDPPRHAPSENWRGLGYFFSDEAWHVGSGDETSPMGCGHAR